MKNNIDFQKRKLWPFKEIFLCYDFMALLKDQNILGILKICLLFIKI